MEKNILDDFIKEVIETLQIQADSANDKINMQDTEKDMAFYDGYEEGYAKAVETIKKISEKYQIQT